MICAGTLGGSISCYDYEIQKGKFKIFWLFIVITKLNGHLSHCTSLISEKTNNSRLLISGSVDTNVKIWDLRMK